MSPRADRDRRALVTAEQVGTHSAAPESMLDGAARAYILAIAIPAVLPPEPLRVFRDLLSVDRASTMLS